MLILLFFSTRLDYGDFLFCCVQYHRIIHNHTAYWVSSTSWVSVYTCADVLLSYIRYILWILSASVSAFFILLLLFSFSFFLPFFFGSFFILHCSFIIRNEIGEYKKGAIRSCAGPFIPSISADSTIPIQFDLFAAVFIILISLF